MVRSNPSTFTRDWALRWVRGSVESYLLGRTSLEVVRGRVRRAVGSQIYYALRQAGALGLIVEEGAVG